MVPFVLGLRKSAFVIIKMNKCYLFYFYCYNWKLLSNVQILEALKSAVLLSMCLNTPLDFYWVDCCFNMGRNVYVRERKCEYIAKLIVTFHSMSVQVREFKNIIIVFNHTTGHLLQCS